MFIYVKPSQSLCAAQYFQSLPYVSFIYTNINCTRVLHMNSATAYEKWQPVAQAYTNTNTRAKHIRNIAVKLSHTAAV